MTETIIDTRAKTTGEVTGNIVLFQSYGDTLAEQEAANVVKWATHGPYVHAAIIVSEKLDIIEARLDGVKKGVLLTKNNGTPHAVYQVCALRSCNRDSEGIATALDISALNRALAWLNRQAEQADEYGWYDIADQSLDFLFGNSHPRVTQPGRFDCSNLATMFLFLCGVNLPFAPPFDVSPNDLAEFFGLLPQRRRVYP